ncbi:hypothetical protein XH88_17355 [Bradyrhizobium sp. CCBAU 51627]|nr:hypothetical protein [Bradyrhizobium sp. CCBAU 51627]
MWSLRFGRQATAARNFGRLIRQFGQLLIEEEVHKGSAVIEFFSAQRSALGDVMPIFETSPAACRRRVLRVIDCIALERSLTTVTGRLGDGEVFPEPVSGGILQCDAPFALGVAHCVLVNRTVEEVVPYQLVLKRLKGMRRIALVTAM